MKTVLKAATTLLFVLAFAAFLLVSARVGPPPDVQIHPSSPAIGPRTSVAVTASASGRGLAGLRVEVEQDGRVHLVAQKSHRPRPPWSLSRTVVERDELHADVGRSALPELKEGEALVRVVAERASTWLRHPAPVVKEMRLPVRLTPPALSLLTERPHVKHGGSGILAYRVGPTAVRDGVRAGTWFFPGSPRPGGSPGERIVLFGVPCDLDREADLRVVAEDDAGNAAGLAFTRGLLRRPAARDRIVLEDAFLQRVVPEILGQTPAMAERGVLLEDYLRINRDLRRANAEELVALARRSAPSALWNEPFLALRGAKVMSSFADRRTYVYEGREVDEQTHLGFDLAAVERTPVPAANRGTVLLARYFGIYGNAVVLDHGLGLQTLYGHLSAIDVKEGQTVERGELLGRTGATGLAGGDHLHFTTLVGGLPVDPTEWWDAAWIRNRVASDLGISLPEGR